MSAPHVCFADDLQAKKPNITKLKTSSNGSLNNNNNNANSNSNLKLEASSQSSPGSSLSVSPTPRFERNMGFFQHLSRRFGLRSSDDLNHADDVVAAASAQEEDTHSSSTDSCSSTGRVNGHHHQQQISFSMSCASSETSSTLDMEEREMDQPIKQTKPATLGQSGFSRLHRRSTSSLRRAFESLSLTSRSLSCSGHSPPPPIGSNSLASVSTAMPLKSALKSASNVELNKHQQRHQAGIPTSSSTSKSKVKAKPQPQRILRQPVSYTYLKGMSGLPTQRVPRSSVCCQYARR
ncbi:uncharacterized protein DDB_G0287625 [Drosophila tropicalis]|uniref:uncharacterized protein DDB_G0287625 n=1 Tax=Drosophila tropicalis TaxID=46794 RepID=UPI0035ABBC47